MAMKQDITIQIGGLSELMEQLSAYEKDTTGRTCVTVLDVYCSTWGACDALKSTFKDITIQEVDDQAVSLKFCQVNASEVLNDLKNRTSTEQPLPPQAHKRPVELQKDILPDAWKDKFQSQIGRAKPMFMFYKDCEYVNTIEGVNTPYIKRIIKQLIKEKKPASEFITNADLLEMWTNEFGALESEVPWAKFCSTVNIWCLFPPDAPAFNDEETKALMAALNVDKGGMPMVTAKGLQEWVGSEKFDTVFRATLPNYETRIHEERVRKEQSEKDAAAGIVREEPKKEDKEPQQEAGEEKKEDTQNQAQDADKDADADADGTKEGAPQKAEPLSYENVGQRCVVLGDGEPPVLGTAGQMLLHGSFTIAMWVCPAEGAGYEERTNNDMGLVGCGKQGEPRYFHLALRELKPRVLLTGSDDIMHDEAVAEQEWTHIAFSFANDTFQGTLYVNGKQVDTRTLSSDAVIDPDAAVSLGALYEQDANTAFVGKIAALCVANDVSPDFVEKSFGDKSLCQDTAEEEAQQTQGGEGEEPEKETTEEEKKAEAASPTTPNENPELNATNDSYNDDTPQQEAVQPPTEAEKEDGKEEGVEKEKEEQPKEEALVEEGEKKEEQGKEKEEEAAQKADGEKQDEGQEPPGKPEEEAEDSREAAAEEKKVDETADAEAKEEKSEEAPKAEDRKEGEEQKEEEIPKAEKEEAPQEEKEEAAKEEEPKEDSKEEEKQQAQDAEQEAKPPEQEGQADAQDAEGADERGEGSEAKEAPPETEKKEDAPAGEQQGTGDAKEEAEGNPPGAEG